MAEGSSRSALAKMKKKAELKRFVPLEDPEKIGSGAVPAKLNKGNEVENYRSVFTVKQVERSEEKQRQLASLGDVYGVSFRDYELLLPQERRAGNVATHDGAAICFYFEHFVCGFRLPLSAFAACVCEQYGVCPNQFTPNSWKMITGFESICFQINSRPVFAVFNRLVTAKRLGDWVSLSWQATEGFVTTEAREKDGWRSRFFVLRQREGRPWGFRSFWRSTTPLRPQKGEIPLEGVEAWTCCRQYRFRWRDVCDPERLALLRPGAPEIPREAMPELLAADVVKGRLIRFIFPRQGNDAGMRIPYEEGNAEALMKEFQVKKRRREAAAAVSSPKDTGEESSQEGAIKEVAGTSQKKTAAPSSSKDIPEESRRPPARQKHGIPHRQKRSARRGIVMAQSGDPGTPTAEGTEREVPIVKRPREVPVSFREPAVPRVVTTSPFGGKDIGPSGPTETTTGKENTVFVHF